MGAAVQISGVEFQYRASDFTLRIPELSIEAGSRAAIIGPSGSGKTTLLNLISGVSVPLRGSIQVDGINIAALAEAARRSYRIQNIGMVFQEFELLEYLTVLDNILLPYRITPALHFDRNVRKRAVDLAGKVGIGDKIERPVDHLSHGERQRVGICRALVTQPSLILADEPTGSLDPANKGRVLGILADYATTNNATLVAVTHDHELLSQFGHVVDFRDLASPRVAERVPA